MKHRNLTIGCSRAIIRFRIIFIQILSITPIVDSRYHITAKRITYYSKCCKKQRYFWDQIFPAYFSRHYSTLAEVFVVVDEMALKEGLSNQIVANYSHNIVTSYTDILYLFAFMQPNFVYLTQISAYLVLLI